MLSVKRQDETRLPVPPLDAATAAALAGARQATFALGWFWGPDALYGINKGVLRTRAGYCGGTKENPTYRSLGDHSETIQMDFDPESVSYAELLDMFWKSHQPEYKSWSRQYASFIFYHDEVQHNLAVKTKEREEERLKKKLHTTIVPCSVFYPAEDYHQKYYLRQQSGIMADFNRMYPDARDFMNSTAAARINGYAAGCGSPIRLKAELESFGLTPEGGRRLMDIVNYIRR